MSGQTVSPTKPMVWDGKTHVIAEMIRDYHGSVPARILVVGCGSGIEAAVLAEQLGTSVTGIDMRDKFNESAMQLAHLRLGDATNLDFPDNSFECVFSYHALEHIPNYRQALASINRVLTTNGTFFIGTPNRQRLIGYLGSKDLSWKQRLDENLRDWRFRVQGKFENRYGAHAGFSSDELKSELERYFSRVEDCSLTYYLGIYTNYVKLVNLLFRSPFGRFAFPSVYFIGRK